MMIERGVHASLPISWILKALPTLSASLLLTMVLLWSIDCQSIRSMIKSWQNQQQDYGREPLMTATMVASPSPSQNLSLKPNTITPSSDNCTTTLAPPHMSHSSTPTKWISLNLEPNLTSNLLFRWTAPSNKPCLVSRSEKIKIPALDNQKSITLSTGEIHQFIFSAYDSRGDPRCSGGDYFETDVSGERWKSRPPVIDIGNGSYSLSLQVHPDFAGEYDLTIFLLFRSFEGLRFSPLRFAFRRELRRIRIKFIKSSSKLPDIHVCRRSDFNKEIWTGRWTRHGKNDQCEISRDGRYQCLSADYPCQSPWCYGSLGSLESNGWVYSAHCAFHLFTMDSAWKCLKNRWIFFWGDSNHVDTIRNLLNFILGRPDITSIPRRIDMNFTNAEDPTQSIRITSIFNGHWNASLNYEGLNSLQNKDYRKILNQYFSGKIAPDSLIMNSGLHDGVKWKSLKGFADGADYAVKFWEEVLRKNGGNRTKLFYRTTVATGGYARDLIFNPNKMDVYNQVLLDKLRERDLLSGGVIDNFDMTFPWHYDNRCNDGVHYGRAPSKARWRDGEIGHQYFVDLMLGHVLLNALCAD